jgi:hypothetical protein
MAPGNGGKELAPGTFKVILEKAGCPERTLREAMRKVGEPIPEPHTSVDYVEVAA